MDNNAAQADIARIAKLKELASSGQIEGPSSYFNHLIDMYGHPGRLGAQRTMTDRERKRVDAFLASFADRQVASGQWPERGD